MSDFTIDLWDISNWLTDSLTLFWPNSLTREGDEECNVIYMKTSKIRHFWKQTLDGGGWRVRLTGGIKRGFSPFQLTFCFSVNPGQVSCSRDIAEIAKTKQVTFLWQLTAIAVRRAKSFIDHLLGWDVRELQLWVVGSYRVKKGDGVNNL